VQDCINIRGDNDSEFSLPGDGGAAIVRDDGALLGILIGAFAGGKDKPGRSIAAPIGKALKDLDLTLLTSDGSTIQTSKAPKKRRHQSKTKRKTK